MGNEPRMKQDRRGGGAARALLLLVLLGGVVFLLPSDRGPDFPTPPAPTPTPSPTPTEPADSRLLPVSDLRFRAPPEIRESCRPIDIGEAPFEILDCFEGITRALYIRFASPEMMDGYFDSVISDLGLPEQPGGCEAGTPSLETWRYTHIAARAEGRMACFLDSEGAPTTMITQPARRLVATVISNPTVALVEHQAKWSTLVPNPGTDEQPGISGG